MCGQYICGFGNFEVPLPPENLMSNHLIDTKTDTTQTYDDIRMLHFDSICPNIPGFTSKIKFPSCLLPKNFDVKSASLRRSMKRTR